MIDFDRLERSEADVEKVFRYLADNGPTTYREIRKGLGFSTPRLEAAMCRLQVQHRVHRGASVGGGLIRCAADAPGPMPGDAVDWRNVTSIFNAARRLTSLEREHFA